MNKSRNFDSPDRSDGRKGIKKLQRIKNRHEINQKIKNITEGDLNESEFESREKFKR